MHPAGPKSLVLHQTTSSRNTPSYIHPIIPPPKNEGQSWENKIGLPHQEPTISGGMCLTLPNVAVIWDMDTGYSLSLKWKLSSHHLTGSEKSKLAVAVV